jgi:hypothetical protein
VNTHAFVKLRACWLGKNFSIKISHMFYQTQNPPALFEPQSSTNA